jgi:hypothetical protein
VDSKGESGVDMIKGRGTDQNPKNRFERLRVISDLEQVQYDDEYLDKLQHPLTQYIPDSAQSISQYPSVGIRMFFTFFSGTMPS